MADAAVTDLRGEDVLPDLLKVINSARSPTHGRPRSSKLQTWLAAGAKRMETTAGSQDYADADAIRVMDAWWPLLVQAEFQPGLGDGLYTALTGDLPDRRVARRPARPDRRRHAGKGSFQYGWWTYVDKDIRAVLGEPVQGGAGRRRTAAAATSAACRDMLLTTLKQAAGRTAAARSTPATTRCSAGDQWCADSIVQRTAGRRQDATISWQNRPTYQQVVEFPSHR